MAKRAVSPATDDSPSRTLIERAYTQLRDDIVSGRLPPDEKLRVEHLKDRYGVGAGTLREAITRLASDALVVTEGQRGFRVAPIAVADLRDLTRLRIHIELDALRLSLRHGDAAWKARLQAAYTEMSRLEQPLQAGHAKSWDALNTAFHEALLSGHDSPWTLRLLRTLSRQGERYRRYSINLPQSQRDVHAEHREIFGCAMAGNELRAALALEAHIQATADLVTQALQALPSLNENGTEPAPILRQQLSKTE